MSTALVIEHFDVGEQLHLPLAATVEPIGELAFDRREEAFHHGIVDEPFPEAAASPCALGLIRFGGQVDYAV